MEYHVAGYSVHMLNSILFLLACVVYVDNCHDLKYFVDLKANSIRRLLVYCESEVKVAFVLHHFVGAVGLKLWLTAYSDIGIPE